ncbi:MAG: hypothetical protein ABIR79_01820 [Candidatus Binatia bacterium]
MPTIRHLHVLVCALVAALLLFPPSARALSGAELKCQSEIGKASSRFAKTIHQAHRRCEDERVKQGSCTQDRRAARVMRAAERLVKELTNRCESVALGNLGFPGACPDAAGPPFTTSDLLSCLDGSHRPRLIAALGTAYPGDAVLVATRLRCQAQIGVASERLVLAVAKTRQRCLDRQLAGKTSSAVQCRAAVPPFGPGTGDATTDRRLGKAGAKLESIVARGCGGVVLEELGFPGACADPDGAPFTASDLTACVGGLYRQVAHDLIEFEYPGGPGPIPTSSPTVAPTPTATAPTATATDGGPTATPTPIPTLTPIATPTAGPGVGDLRGLVAPDGDADGDGFSNTIELASCSNPADPASTPENDASFCNNNTIFSDARGPAWGNTNKLAEPTYGIATTTLQAQNAADCGVYCQTTPNIGSPEACNGNWPWSGVPEHGFYELGATVEANFPDESGNRLAATIFLPPGVTCTPDDAPVCDGVTDPVVCTAPGGATYPAVVITEGFTGSQRMYFWAAHRLAAQGYVTMTFDVSGQGRSQGSFPNGDAGIAADQSGGGSGFARDSGAALNWFVSSANPIRNLVAIDPLLIPNQGTGATSITEDYVLGLAGHSAGATGAITYQQSTVAAYPVRTRAVVGWSHFDAAGTIGNVPIQMHSGDEDSGFIQPPGSGNQGPAMERRYDRLRGDRDLNGTPDFTPHDRQIVMLEDGTHLSYSQVPWAYYPTWGEEVQYHYTLAWFDKYLRGDLGRTMGAVTANVIQSVDPYSDYFECTSGPDCYSATARLKMSHVHLSDTWCSRYDIGGDANTDVKGGGCRTQ